MNETDKQYVDYENIHTNKQISSRNLVRRYVHLCFVMNFKAKFQYFGHDNSNRKNQ